MAFCLPFALLLLLGIGLQPLASLAQDDETRPGQGESGPGRRGWSSSP